MKPTLVWRPQAREDLLDIYLAIGIDNVAAAERLYTAIEEKAPTARMLVEGVYLILYETHPDTDEGPVDGIEIVRLMHGHRDLSRIF
jgi:toxin ParE1/3/4